MILMTDIKGVAPPGHSGALPWVKLRSAAAGPQAFRRMISETDPKARPGDIVAVYDKSGAPYGIALYNPKSLITLRLISRDSTGFDVETHFKNKLRQAAELRRDILKLDAASDAYRLVHDYGDGLPGLVVDRYGDNLVLEFYSLAMFQQAERLERILLELYPGSKTVRRASDYTEQMEGFRVRPSKPPPKSAPRHGGDAAGRVRIRENGVLFEADLTGGHKTGFFCDQRENRLAMTAFSPGRKVLDICSYTGGFGLYASKLGGASAVTCVELDPEAAELGKRNANINQLRINAVNGDAFPYLRQMAHNKERFGLVILDPYKLIASREGYSLGSQKYTDFNRLALGVLEPGGFFITCSCSGLLSWEEFEKIVRAAAGSVGRRLQIFKKTGAGPDHPYAVDYPEGEYLKVLWARAI